MSAAPDFRKIAGLVFAIAVPLGLVLAWHALNHAYPRGDATDFIRCIEHHYHQYQSGGVAAFLKDLYWSRPWKPILLPVLAAPFSLLTGGHVLRTVALTTGFTFAVFLAYAYLLLVSASSPLRAAIATVFIGTIPAIINSALVLYTELPLMACLAASLYHFRRAELGASRAHSLAFALGLALALCVRPIETLLLTAPLLIAFGWALLKRKELTPLDLGASLALALGSAFILFWPKVSGTAWTDMPEKPLGLVMLPFLLFSGAYLAYRRRSVFGPAFVLALGIVTVWFSPFGHTLWNWIYSCSFSPPLRAETSRFNRGEIYFGVFRDIASWRLLVLTALAVVPALASRREPLSGMSKVLVACPLAGWALHLLAGFASYSIEIRYFNASVAFVLLALATLALQTRWALLLLPLAALQTGAVVGMLRHPIPQSRSLIEDAVAIYPPVRGPDPAVAIVRQIQPHAEKPAVRIFKLQQVTDDELNWSFTDQTLMNVAEERGLRWEIPTQLPETLSTTQARLEYVMANHDFILLGPVAAPTSSMDEAHRELALELLKRWKTRRLGELGLELSAEIGFITPVEGLSGTLLLLKPLAGRAH